MGPGCINLINVYEAVLTRHHLGLIMEYAAGGSLTSAVAEAWTQAKPGGLVVSEDRARFLFRQSIEAVNYCHRHYIAHRCAPSPRGQGPVTVDDHGVPEYDAERPALQCGY